MPLDINHDKTFSGHPWTSTLPLDGFHTHQNPLNSGNATNVTCKVEYYVFSYILLTKLNIISVLRGVILIDYALLTTNPTIQ